MNRDDNKLVFVSYAHADEAFLKKELMPFLEDLELDEEIELWHDRMIGTGENWYTEIADRLDRAKVAILLVTQEFLSSKFCRLEEVPVLLQRASSRRASSLATIRRAVSMAEQAVAEPPPDVAYRWQSAE